MSSLGYITQVLAADVANSATVTVSYPTGYTRATLSGASSGDLTINDGQGGALNEGAGGFSLVYGASTITVTNLSGYTWVSGSTLRLSFGENAPAGSYEVVLPGGVVGGTAAKAGVTQQLTASGAATPGIQSLELNHATVAIAATMLVVPNTFFILKDTSASGTALHNLTLTGGTFNGTNTVATMNAPNDALVVFFDSAGNGTILENVGAVVLS